MNFSHFTTHGFAYLRRRKKAFVLVTTLLFLVIALWALASIFSWSATNSKITQRNILFNQAQAAAESSTETVMASMIRDFYAGNLSSAGTYASLTAAQTNWPIRFLFTDASGAAGKATVIIQNSTWSPLPARYSGLYGIGQNCTILSTATPVNQPQSPSATIAQNVWFGAIPIFQFAIFYNMDLEINPGSAMNINGKTHANGNIYATGSGASTPLTFSSTVEASGSVKLTPDSLDPHNQGRSGNVVFQLTANNPLNKANTLNLPVGTNNDPATVASIIDLPPASLRAPIAAAYSPDGQEFLYNEADLIVSTTDGTNMLLQYQNPNLLNPLTTVPADLTNIIANTVNTGTKGHPVYVTTYATNFLYSFVTNASFYDYREYSTVLAVQIDVARFNVWLTNLSSGKSYDSLNSAGYSSKGHGINSIYVYNAVPRIAGSPSTAGQMAAVRLVNGQRLSPAGLTVAAGVPAYIEGDYNVTTDGTHFARALGGTGTNTEPAAIIADAVTILSTNWNDGNNIKGLALGTRKAANTSINIATMEGIVPSDGLNYSGGVENFLRLLEDWSQNGNSGKQATLTYNGSIVVMFPSRYASDSWQTTGVYYNPPNRQWGFDTNFTTLSGLPPLTPSVKAVVRESWQAK